MSKLCIRCKCTKSDNAFIGKRGKPVLFCDECRHKQEQYFELNKKHKRTQEKQWRDANSNRVKEYNKEYRIRNRDRVTKAEHEWYEHNKEYKKEYARQWREENPERSYQTRRAWRENNPEKTSAMIANAYAKRVSKIDETISKEDWIFIMQLTGWKCFYCGCNLTKGNRHLDHYIPLSKGGAHHVENLAPSCKSCNLRKHDKLPHDFFNPNKW